MLKSVAVWEASEMGLPPGEFPDFILHNGFEYHRSESQVVDGELVAVIYINKARLEKIAVLND